MAKDRRPAEDLSIEELEGLLARKRLEARHARLQEFRRSGRALKIPAPSTSDRPASSGDQAAEGRPDEEGPGRAERRRGSSALSRALLFIEVAAVTGLVWVLLSGVGALRVLNQEVAEALEGGTAAPTPRITAVVLPSGHTPPTSPGGAQPNDAEIPEHLRPLVQALPPIAIPTPGPEQATTIFIPRLGWPFPAPVVQGDGWEQLKKGVAQHIGSANPGQSGNVVLSAHNDIFGELFRYLDRLQPGDEVILTTATREYTYRVTGTRIVEPTDVEVMDPTERPTVTLISCYPYLIDTERIVVFAELVDG